VKAVAILAEDIAQYRPLLSTRPMVPNEKPVPVLAKQDVDARLWRDPIGVAEKQKSVVDPQLGADATKTIPLNRTTSTLWSSFFINAPQMFPTKNVFCCLL
jgi:hypothetical protein